MEMQTLQDLYLETLKDLWSAEKQLTKAIPKMAKAASHPELVQAFNTHLKQTEQQVTRLEEIFEELGESPRGKKCKGMEGLIEEGDELIKEKPAPDVLDAGLISAAQHVEHYEIAGYGTARTYAQLLGFEKQAQLLQETLDEEGETDKLLTQLAERSINLEAMTADEDEAESESRSSRRSEREVPRRAAAESGARGAKSGAKSGSGNGRGRSRETRASSR